MWHLPVPTHLVTAHCHCSLSGVGSILGEIFVKDHLKAEDIGLTQDAADRLVRKAAWVFPTWHCWYHFSSSICMSCSGCYPQTFLWNWYISQGVLPAAVAIPKTSVVSFPHLCHDLPLLLFLPLFPPISYLSIHCVSWCGQNISDFFSQNYTASFMLYLVHSSFSRN